MGYSSRQLAPTNWAVNWLSYEDLPPAAVDKMQTSLPHGMVVAIIGAGHIMARRRCN